MRMWEDWRKHLECKDMMRILDDHSKGHITLSNEKMTVMNAISRGEYLFLTGSAGTGKRYVFNFVVKILKKLHGPGFVFVTTSRGISTCHLSGMNLHSFVEAPPFVLTK